MIKIEQGAMFVMLPAGRYLIGDPAEALDPHTFDEAMAQSNDFQDQCFGYFSKEDGARGVVIAFSATNEVSSANGTTVFCDNENAKHESDSGFIAIIPVKDVAHRFSNMHIYDFATSFLCYEDGSIVFGDIIIDTYSDDLSLDGDDDKSDDDDQFTFDDNGGEDDNYY